MNSHENHHDYLIIRNEFPLIQNSGWSARQELQLLDMLLSCGYGNWSDISRRMRDKTIDECRSHYHEHYIDHQSLAELPKFRDNRTIETEPVPFLFKVEDLDEPPRFAPTSSNYKLLAGYNAVRSDFEVNFDNHAELLISDLKFNEFQKGDLNFELGQSLQVALLSSYNNRLKERFRRKRIIREHGLMAFRKTMRDLQRYETTIGRATCDRLAVFMQLTSGLDFDYILEGLHRAGELKSYINRLLEFRRNGLSKFSSVPVYQTLEKIRQEFEKERRNYLTCGEYSWKSIVCVNSVVPIVAPPTNSQRKIPPPLQIQGLPMYDKLTPEEKELCSTVRLIPQSYLEFRHQLVMENKKYGSLRLAQARVLLKIDVNKTRKIYDFLAERGFINKPLN